MPCSVVTQLQSSRSACTPKVMLHDLLQLSSIPAIHTKACEVPKLVSAQSWSWTFKP